MEPETQEPFDLVALHKRLEGSTDAKVWAEVFVAMQAANPKIASDEGTMIAWFANAMETASQAVAPPAQTTRALLDELERRIPVDKLGPLATLRSQIGPAFLDKRYIDVFLARVND